MKNLASYEVPYVAFADKQELRLREEIVGGRKVRTMLPDNLYKILWHKYFFMKQSAQLMNVKDIYYGWSPFGGNVNKLGRKIQGKLDMGWSVTDFDVSGFDRKYPLGKEVWDIRLSGVEIPDRLMRRLKFQMSYDIAPAVLILNEKTGKHDLWRMVFQSSGKDETTGDNSIAHLVVKFYHVARYLSERRFSETDVDAVLQNFVEFIIYSDDNVNLFGPELEGANSHEEWARTYSHFGWEVRDFQLRTESVLGLKFLGFNFVFHWRHPHLYSPAFNQQRIRDSLFFGDRSVTVEKYWGLFLLAYSTGEEVFRYLLTFRERVLSINPEYSLGIILDDERKICSFFDSIVFGFESSVNMEVGGFNNEQRKRFIEETVLQTAKDYEIGPQRA